VRTNDLSITIAGFAGQGVKTAGAAFAKVCSRAGLHVFQRSWTQLVVGTGCYPILSQ
jgi:Pyruvate/2-oxoacid:ferredoxin oxidoreductase gamma subunit